MTDPTTRLRLLIAVSGLSHKAYAETVLGRSERAVQYWLAGRFPIPHRVQAQLDAMPLPTHLPEEIAR